MKNGKSWPGGVKVRKRNKNARQQARRNEKLAARIGDVATMSQIAATKMEAMVDPLDTAAVIAKRMRLNNTAFDRSTLEGKKVDELREIATAKGLKTTTKTRKGDIIEMLVGR